MRRKLKETDRFIARTATGETIVLVEYTTYIEAATFEGSSWVQGMKRLQTIDGQPVNFRDEGKYELLDGTPLSRV